MSGIVLSNAVVMKIVRMAVRSNSIFPYQVMRLLFADLHARKTCKNRRNKEPR